MQNKTKKILFLTGTRADFGKLLPLARGASDRGYDVSFFITGMHMLEAYGLTKIEVHRQKGFQCHEFLNQNEGEPQDIILTNTIKGFSAFLKEHHYDLVVVHGDRVEAFAATIVCSINYIRCAHIEGGEVSGTIDEAFRHCNSKLAHAHFASSQTAVKRLQSLGEAPEAIHLIGSPEIDLHKTNTALTIEEVKRYYGIQFQDYGICIFHPVTSEQDTIAQQSKSLFSTLKRSGKPFVVIKPNNDPGCHFITAEIDRLPDKQFVVIPSMRFLYFSTLMRCAKLIIGNSSASVREAPFFGVPSISVGTRQNARAFSPSISQFNGSSSDALLKLIENNWGKSFASSDEFGFGNASEGFLDALSQDDFWQASLQKTFTE